MLAIAAPLPQFFDLNGLPLDQGFVYVGKQSQNPQTSPIPIYWDEAGTIPAAQPLRTLNGYIARNGTPTNVYTRGLFSLQVTTKNNVQILYSASSAVGTAQEVITYKRDAAGAVAQTLKDVLGQIISVREFGSVGDGIADDTLAIKNAVAFASQLPTGAVVWFPDGQYKISQTITVAANGVCLQGSSSDCVQVIRATEFGPTFVFSKANTSVLDGAGISGMRIVDNGANNASGTAILVENASRWACSDLILFGGKNGIILKGAANVGISDVFMYMQTPGAPSVGRYGVSIVASDIPDTPIPFGSNVQLTNVHIYGGDNIAATYANLEACLEVEAVDGLWLTSCYFGGAERADMWITRISADHACGNIFASNTMWDICRGNGVLFGGSVLAQRIRLHGAVSCAGAGVADKDGIYIAGPVDNVVLDTTIDGWKGNGLHLGVTAGQTCSNITFSNGTSTANTGYGVQIEANTGTNQLIISGNNLAGNGIGSIRDFSATATLKHLHGNLAYNVPWETYAPFVGALTGTVTTPATGRYQQIGSTVSFKVQIGPVSADTGASYVTFTLPPVPGNPVDAFALAASELTTNATCTSRTQAGSNVATLLRYDGTYPSAAGRTFIISGTYQVA